MILLWHISIEISVSEFFLALVIGVQRVGCIIVKHGYLLPLIINNMYN